MAGAALVDVGAVSAGDGAGLLTTAYDTAAIDPMVGSAKFIIVCSPVEWLRWAC